MRKMLLSMFVSLFIFSIIANAVALEKNKNVPTTTKTNSIYTEDKPNISVDVKHPEFTFQIESNPTTGYSWFLREYDVNLIVPVKHSFQTPEKALMGAPGYELWTFRVKPIGFIVPQQTIIRMTYARPWQGSDSSTQLVFRISTQGK